MQSARKSGCVQWIEVNVCVCVWFMYDGGDNMSHVLCVCVSPCGVGAL